MKEDLDPIGRLVLERNPAHSYPISRVLDQSLAVELQGEYGLFQSHLGKAMLTGYILQSPDPELHQRWNQAKLWADKEQARRAAVEQDLNRGKVEPNAGEGVEP